MSVDNPIPQIPPNVRKTLKVPVQCLGLNQNYRNTLKKLVSDSSICLKMTILFIKFLISRNGNYFDRFFVYDEGLVKEPKGKGIQDIDWFLLQMVTRNTNATPTHFSDQEKLQKVNEMNDQYQNFMRVSEAGTAKVSLKGHLKAYLSKDIRKNLENSVTLKYSNVCRQVVSVYLNIAERKSIVYNSNNNKTEKSRLVKLMHNEVDILFPINHI